MKELYEKLEKLENEIFEIVSVGGETDELDVLSSDINADWELGIIEDMDFNDLEKYVNNVENILIKYRKVLNKIQYLEKEFLKYEEMI